MPMYRKKATVVEAWLYTHDGNGSNPFPQFITDGIISGEIVESRISGQRSFSIDTKNGIMRANKGDWIIKYPDGTLVPCTNENFEKLFEAI